MKKVKLLSIGLCIALALMACGKKDSTKSNVKVTLGTYMGVQVNTEPVQVSEEEVQVEIDSLLQQYPNYTKVTDHTDIKDGDMVDIDFKGSVDGKEFEGGSAENYKLTIGAGSFIDDFESQLIGHKAGETVDVNVTFPEKYDSNPDLAGKNALFVVTIHDIVLEEQAEFNDAFVAENTSYKTVDEYREKTQETLLGRKQSQVDSQKEMDIISAVIENATFENLEQTEIDTAASEMDSYYKAQAESYGVDYATFKLYFFGMDEPTFETELKKAAELQIKQRYVMNAIVEKEKLTFTQEEYDDALAKFAEMYQAESVEKFEETYTKEKVEEALLLDKALQLVKDNAIVTEVVVTE